MKRILRYLFCFQVSLLKVEGHQSVLIDVFNANKVSIKNSFDNAKIKNSLPFESSGTKGDNCDGITCFSTYGGFAKLVREGSEDIKTNPNSRGDIPRCHSEVFLLKALENDCMVSLGNEEEPLILENGSIIIQNQGKCDIHNKINEGCLFCKKAYPPCNTPYGKNYKNWQGKIVTECNPGISCDEYINQFACEYKCTVIIKFPKYGSPWRYPK